MLTIVIGFLGLVVLVLLIGMAACEREEVKAKNNRDRYWSHIDD